MKLRKLQIKLTNCHDCPYNFYDSRYGNTTDSGFYCQHENGARQVEDNQITRFNKQLKEWEDSQLTLFPLSESDKPINPLVKRFNEHCPLQDISKDVCEHENYSSGHSPFVACVCDDCGQEL